MVILNVMNRKYLVTFIADNSVGTMYILTDRRPSEEDIHGLEGLARDKTKKKQVTIINLVEISMDKKEKRDFAITAILSVLFLIALGVACAGLVLTLLWLLGSAGSQGVVI